MAWVQADLDALETAIATGELTVQYQDRRVTYRSMDELMKARTLLRDSLGVSTSIRHSFVQHSKG